MNRRKEIADTNEDEWFAKEQAMEKLREANEQWDQLKQHGKQHREKEVLDYHNCELENDTERNKK